MFSRAAMRFAGKRVHRAPRVRVPGAVWQLLGFIVVAISFFWGEFIYFGAIYYNPLSGQNLKYIQSALTASPSEVPVLLQKMHVAISFHYNVQRLSYLFENLETISRWETEVDVCIGTDAPEKLLIFLQNASTATAFTQRVTMCPVQDLSLPFLLNWRTRESIQTAFASPVNYTAFVFAEGDLFVTWEALLKWEEDTQILYPHNFTRTFFRYEVSPQDGKSYSLDFHNSGPSRAIAFFEDDVQKETRHFVQAGGFEGTYSGIFVATRAQMSRFIASEFWSFAPNTFCCDEGGREDASWRIQAINVPEGWDRTGLLPFDAVTGRIDERAMLFHRPNNYYGRAEGWTGLPLEGINDAFRDLVVKKSDPVTLNIQILHVRANYD